MSRESFGRGSFAEATAKPSSPSLAKQIEWAKSFLPSEDPGYVVTAAWSVKDARKPVTPENVRQRLQDTGRTRAQLERKAAV